MRDTHVEAVVRFFRVHSVKIVTAMKRSDRRNVHLLLIISCVVVFLSAFQNCAGGFKANQNSQSEISSSAAPPNSDGSSSPVGSSSYNWMSGGFNPCSAICGGGFQSRTVQCVDSQSAVAADSSCNGSKPGLAQTCNPQACTTPYNWVTEPYGVCAAGMQTRTVSCQDNLGLVVKNSLCTTAAPSSTASCTPIACNASTCDVWISSAHDFANIVTPPNGAAATTSAKRYCLNQDIDFAGTSQAANPDTVPPRSVTYVDLNGCGHTVKNLQITNHTLFDQFNSSALHDIIFDSPSGNISNSAHDSALLVNTAFFTDFYNIQVKNIQFSLSSQIYDPNNGIISVTSCGGLFGLVTGGSLKNISINGGTVTISNCQNEGVVAGTQYSVASSPWPYGYPDLQVASNKVFQDIRQTRVLGIVPASDVSNINVTLDDAFLNGANIRAGGVLGLVGAQDPGVKLLLDTISFQGRVHFSQDFMSGGIFGEIDYGSVTLEKINFSGAISSDSASVAGLVGEIFGGATPAILNSSLSGTLAITSQGTQTGMPALYVSGSDLTGAITISNTTNTLTATSNGAPVTAGVGCYRNGDDRCVDISAAASTCQFGGQQIPMYVGDVVRYYYSSMTGTDPTDGCGQHSMRITCQIDPSHSYVQPLVIFLGSIDFTQYNLNNGPPINFPDNHMSIWTYASNTAPPTPVPNLPQPNTGLALSSLWSQLSPTCIDSTGANP